MSLDNLTAIEAVWLALSLVAFAFTLSNQQGSYADLAHANTMSNGRAGTRRAIAKGYIFRNWIRVAIFAWWTLLGIAFGLFELPDTPRLALVLGLVVTVGGHAIIAVHEAQERRFLDAAIIPAVPEADILQASELSDAKDRLATQRAAVLIARAAADAARLVATTAAKQADDIAVRASEAADALRADVERSMLAAERTADATTRIADRTDQQAIQAAEETAKNTAEIAENTRPESK